MTPEQIVDLLEYEKLLQQFVAILDKESTISSENRKLSEANITQINTVFANILTQINTIVTPV